MNGLMDALGLGHGAGIGMGEDYQQGSVSPLLMQILGGIGGSENAPPWLKKASAWAQSPSGQQMIGQIQPMMQGLNRQYTDALYDRSAWDRRVANPYADIINGDQMQALGLQSNAGRQMGAQGVAQDVYGPVIQNFLRSGALNKLFQKQPSNVQTGV